VATRLNNQLIFLHIIMFPGQKTLALSFIFLFAGLFSLNGQNLFLFDEQTALPIKGVLVFNDSKSKSAYSDEIGIVDLSNFSNEEYLNFQHPYYKTKRISSLTLSTLKYKLSLSPLPDLGNDFKSSLSRWESNTSQFPNKIDVINKDDIAYSNPPTSADLLGSETEAFIQKNQLSGGSPVLRGFDSKRLLFVIDGVKVNNAISGISNLQNIFQADVNSIENAVVIYGPGTNLYGSDAFGGFINFQLLEPKFSKNKKWKTSGHGLARIATADFEKTLHADINFGNNKWALLASISYSDLNDLIMGKIHNDYAKRTEYVSIADNNDSIFRNNNPNIQKFTGFHQLSFISKVKQQFTEAIDWTFSFYMTQTGNVPRYDRLLEKNGEVLKYAEWYYNPQQWLMNSLEINFNGRTKAYDHASFVAAFQNTKVGLNKRLYKESWLFKRSENVNILSANIDFDKVLKWGNTIFYGLDFSYNDLVSIGEKENIQTGVNEKVNPRYPDGSNKYVEASAYFNFKRNLINKPITLLAGIRYSYIRLISTFNDTSFYSYSKQNIKKNYMAITANAGLIYHPGKWLFKFNLSTAYRAPNIDDLTPFYETEPGYVVVPNSNLKPEYLFSAEMGIVYKIFDNFNFEFRGFYNYIKNAMIVQDINMNDKDTIKLDGVISKLQTMVNTTYALIYGTSLDIDWQITRQLSFNQSLTYIKSKDDKGSTYKPVPPFYGTSSIIFTQNQFKISLSANYNSKVSYEEMVPSERRRAYLYASDNSGNPFSPAWWTLNANASYAFNQSFIINLGISNIFDYRYRSYYSGITAPGRNFIFSFCYNF
jgi:hemoglobin/transferrin/lactoferrin receptor protein